MSKIGLLGSFLLVLASQSFAQVPNGFINVVELDSTIKVELRYFSSNNFVGKKIRGYQANTAYLTEEAAKALQLAHQNARKMGMGILIYDAYRPQQAVDHFVQWASNPEDTVKKSEFYPEIRKSKLFENGFIATKSGHSRGSTVDISLYHLATGMEVDMGSTYDLFSVKSYHHSDLVNEDQVANRNLLREIMQSAGFRAYSQEWWHYTLNDEPFPYRYFNFEIK